MRHLHLLVVLALVAIPVAIFAQSQRAQPTPPAPGTFLEPGKEYLIGFPKDSSPFTVYTGTKCEIFRVVRHHENGSWVLVEHPASIEDYGAWRLKHSLPFIPTDTPELTAEDLASFRETAARDIPVTQTWINLNHAVTVKSISSESLGYGG